MDKSAIGFNLGLRGDLIMNTVAARQFKLQFPDYKLTLGIGRPYADMVGLFKNHPFIDDVHVYSTYHNWPQLEDVRYLKEKKYDIVFHGMPPVTSFTWWTARHQTQEVCAMNGLIVPSAPCQCILSSMSDIVKFSKKTLAFAPFAGYYNPSNDKKMSFARASELVSIFIKLGYQVFQVGGPDEPRLDGCLNGLECSYVDSLKHVLGCDLYIGTDTGMTWATSAFNMPTVGLYSDAYYRVDYVKNIQPINPNAIYLSDRHVHLIQDDKIIEAIRKF